MAERTMRIHLVVPDPAGPIKSDGMAVQLTAGIRQTVGGGTFKAACGAKVDGHYERGSCRWYCCHCADCHQTPEYAAAKESTPDPRTSAGPESVAPADMAPKPCAGC